MQSILLPHMLAAGFRHSRASARAVTQKAQHAQHMIGSIYTGHTAGCLQHCNTKLKAMPVCFAKHSAACLPCCKDSGTAELQQCDSESTACTAYERMHLHTGHKAGCPQHCNTQLRAKPVCYAKHSAASYDRQHFHRPHSRVSPALQYKAESIACLLCKGFCCLIC